MRLKPTKNTIILLAGTLGVIIVAVGAIMWLQNAALGQAEQAAKTKSAELSDGQRIARRQETARAALQEDRAKLVFLENGVPDAAYVPTLLKQLEDLAGSTKNRVVSVRPTAAVEAPSRMQQRRDPDVEGKGGGGQHHEGDEKKEVPEPYTRLGIQVALVGGYASVQTFLDRMTRFPKIIAVEEVQLRPHRATSSEASEQRSLLDVDLKLTAFVMKGEQPAAARVSRVASAQVGGIN